MADFSGQMAYVDVQRLFDAVTPFGRHRCYWKSRYLDGLGDDVIDLVVEANRQPPSPGTLSSIWNFGGATAAVAGRRHRVRRSLDALDGLVRLDLGHRRPGRANIAWTRDRWEQLRPYARQDRIYLNFPGHGEDGEDLTRRSFGANYEKLAAIKRRYDPTNMFRFNQNITPSP